MAKKLRDSDILKKLMHSLFKTMVINFITLIKITASWIINLQIYLMEIVSDRRLFYVIDNISSYYFSLLLMNKVAMQEAEIQEAEIQEVEIQEIIS